MSETIKIKKGLHINLKGKAEKVFIKAAPSTTYAVKPTDFPGLVPKLSIKTGDSVKAGSTLFYDKNNPDVKFTSPVSGVVQEVNRGERRKILEVIVKPGNKQEFEPFNSGDPLSMEKKEIIENILNSGLWPSIRQRPYGIIANPKETPKSVFISAFDSNPLGVDYDFILQDSSKEFQTGINALSKLTKGSVHLGINAEYPPTETIANAKNVILTSYKGSHPAGNVGTHIHFSDPINKGEVVWTLSPQDVVTIGRLFLTGKYDASKIIALTGSEVINPRYYKVTAGCNIAPMTKDNITEENLRFISGSALSGTQIAPDGYVGYYDSAITIIPEGNKFEFMGWLAPGFKKFSLSRTFFSWLTPKKEYRIDSNFNGGHRALMITGNFERVFPMDIYPMQLIKAIIIEDIDLMEKLGIYEVVEEDFALCEFVDTSKTDIQAIVRKGLDLMIKEMN